MDKIGAGRQSVKLQGGTAATAALQLVRGHVASGEVGHRYSVETARASRRCGNDEHGAALGGVGGEGEGEASIAYSIDTQLLECADIGQGGGHGRGDIVAAKRAYPEVVGGVWRQTGHGVAVGADGHLGPLAWQEACGTVFKQILLRRRQGVPAEGDTGGGDCRGSKAGDRGARCGGEAQGVAPRAFNLPLAATVAMYTGVVGCAGAQPFDGKVTAVGKVAHSPVAVLPDIELVEGVIACGKPVEGGGGVGDTIDRETFGSGAVVFIGDELDSCPARQAEAVGGAVLPQAYDIPCIGQQAREGMLETADMDRGSGGIDGGGAIGVDGHIVFRTRAVPHDGDALVAHGNRVDNGFGTEREVAGVGVEAKVACVPVAVSLVVGIGVGGDGCPSHMKG